MSNTPAAGQDAGALFAELAAEEAAQPEPGFAMAPEDWLGFALFWAMSLIVFLQFFTRYILNDSIAWTEEIASYMLMVLCFWGSALAARRGTHIAVEFLLDALPRGARRWARLVVACVTTGFFVICTLLCWQVAEAMRFQPMVAIDWPLAYVYYGILAGLALTVLRGAQQALRRFRAGEPEQAVDPSLGGVKL
ncbi:TRAP transporter small permease [Pseudoroseomonas cervicalis]|uniref:TRAP transporter small permease protein n=1 Tax=Pseudoroseomonas cervicalis ATCC 49957 TaxID=525371 RepID=D5RSG0_9PROT|nr:TRAP transporter small permease [Pseudoroseomonas cervicalis]EFH09759.1 TRAP transporter, DctQ-like membrane protein [Pseudoroseomonas cervicalis ATCC 49957]